MPGSFMVVDDSTDLFDGDEHALHRPLVACDLFDPLTVVAFQRLLVYREIRVFRASI